MSKKRRTDNGGTVLERTISQLRLRGFREGFGISPRFYIPNYSYTTIYGTPGRMEYWIQSESFIGRLECKFQGGSGSVDEKLPMITRTFEERIEWPGCIVVLGGVFWDEGRGLSAFKWLEREAERLTKDKRRFIAIRHDDFTDFVDKEWPAR